MLIDLTERDFNDIWNGFIAVPLPPECKLGDEIVFQLDRRPVAKAVVGRIEKFEEHRVFWQPNTFQKLELAAVGE